MQGRTTNEWACSRTFINVHYKPIISARCHMIDFGCRKFASWFLAMESNYFAFAVHFYFAWDLYWDQYSVLILFTVFYYLIWFHILGVSTSIPQAFWLLTTCSWSVHRCEPVQQVHCAERRKFQMPRTRV